jgi:hypothetical protein
VVDPRKLIRERRDREGKCVTGQGTTKGNSESILLRNLGSSALSVTEVFGTDSEAVFYCQLASIIF